MPLLALTVLLLTVGCSMNPGMRPTITLDEAKQRTNAYFREILEALPVNPRLEELGGSPSSIECTDPDDNGPPGRYDYYISFFLRDIPTDRNPEIFARFRSYLTGRGFAEYSSSDGFLAMRSRTDGFTAGLEESGGGGKVLSLTVSAPCVWPNGTPAPR